MKDLFARAKIVCQNAPKPDWIVLEEIHLPPRGIRISNLVHLGEARGVLVVAAAQTKAVVKEIHPLVQKNAITGNGRASKSDVARFLKALLPMNDSSRALDDTTDAIAIALAAAFSSKVQAAVAC